jgi:hypothetical protein
MVPSVDDFGYALNRAFNSATGTIFMIQLPLRQHTAGPEA